jgi:hypothetical protein
VTFYRKGWYGESHRHSLAARGVTTRRYAAQKLVDPVFYAAKQESEVPFIHCMAMVKKNTYFPEMERMHPDADRETLRLRAIKAYDAVHGSDTLSMLNRNGVDESVRLAQKNNSLRQRMIETLKDGQARSMLADVKVDSLLTGLEGMR